MPGWVRREGGGRKTLVESDPGLLPALLALVHPTERGGPMSPVCWTCLSLRHLAETLPTQGHPVSHMVVGTLLKGEGVSLQADRKTLEGNSHPGRDARFSHVNQSVSQVLAAGQPVISADTKKELVGPFRNPARAWRLRGMPEQVRVHDVLVEALGRAVPYGVYDLAANAGWVSVGVDGDTAAFAVQTIRRWWHEGRPAPRPRSPAADHYRRWRRQQRLARAAVQARTAGSRRRARHRHHPHHLPPGTSTWNRIKHRLFSFISQNWRAKPLVSDHVIVSLTGATTTKTGLAVRCELDTRSYPKGIRVSDEGMAALTIHRDPFHGEWNYTIKPHKPEDDAIVLWRTLTSLHQVCRRHCEPRSRRGNPGGPGEDFGRAPLGLPRRKRSL